MNGDLCGNFRAAAQNLSKFSAHIFKKDMSQIESMTYLPRSQIRFFLLPTSCPSFVATFVLYFFFRFSSHKFG